MGDCCSRSNKNDIESHKLKKNKKNDRYFIKVPLKNDEISLESFSTAKLEKKILNLETKKKLFADRYSSLIDSKDFFNELTIEVQKGIDLYRGSCFKEKDLFVRVSFEPKGPHFDTFSSESVLPEWFFIIQIQQSFSKFEEIKFSVLFDHKNTEASILGSANLRISDLKDQMV